MLLGKWPSKFFIGFGEGVIKEDLGSISLTAVRCIREELNVKINLEDVTVFMIAKLKEYMSWGCYAYVDLRGKGINFNADTLIKKYEQAFDAFEVSNLFILKDLNDFPNIYESVPSTFLKRIKEVIRKQFKNILTISIT